MIQVKNLTFSFGKKSLLKNVSINLEPGRIYCLIGENGSGKSTFLKSLAGHYTQCSPYITVKKNRLTELIKTLSLHNYLMLLPQALPRIETFTCREFVKTAFEKEFFVGPSNSEKTRLTQRLEQLLDDWLLRSFEHELVHQLSGGEWRRTQLAFAFARQTPFLVLDEPDSHLDFQHISKLADACRNYVSEGHRTILMATHHLDFAQRIATDFLVLKDGTLQVLSDRSQLKEALEQLFHLPFEESADGKMKAFRPIF